MTVPQLQKLEAEILNLEAELVVSNEKIAELAKWNDRIRECLQRLYNRKHELMERRNG